MRAHRIELPVCALLLALAGCPTSTRETSEPSDPGGPIAEAPAGATRLPIVAVPQQTATEIDLWAVEPGGRRIASAELGECGIWDVASGRMIAMQPLELAPEPCASWPAFVSVFELARQRSADEALELDGDEVVASDSGQTLRTLACPHCVDADALAWSTSGHQVALLFIESLRVEIWDADTGKRLRSEPLAAAGPPQDIALGWASQGPFVVWAEVEETLACDDENGYVCEYDDSGEPLLRDAIARRAQVLGRTPVELGTDQGTLDDLQIDPEGRLVVWTHEWDERRAGTTYYVEVVALGDEPSGLDIEHFEGFDNYEGGMYREGAWRVDGMTHWSVEIVHDDYDGSLVKVDWESTITSPAKGQRSGLVVDELDWGSEVELALFGLVDEGPVVFGQACTEEGCRELGVEPPPDCTLLDVGSGHGSELYDCGGRMHLRSAGKLGALPLDADATFWWWTRGGALILDDGDNFLILDAVSGATGLRRDDVGVVHEGKLGGELDRVVVVGEQGFEVIDTRSLQVVLRGEADDLVDVAFSPTGDRLAILGPEQIRVLALPSGEPLARFASVGGSVIAFRQDGRALFVGDDMPDAILDAADGHPIDAPLLETIADEIAAGGEPDPSWRWIMHDEYGQLTRTLDGRVLAWTGEGRQTAWLPDTGQYSGLAPGLEVAFRVGEDPWGVPEFTAAQLATWLAKPDLVAAFLAGEAIAEPTIDAGELAALRAAKPARRAPP